jgi:DNA/RNA endonuclease G (NUC1)
MRLTRLALGLLVVLAGCTADRSVTTPRTTFSRLTGTANLLPAERISEIHYDNSGTDVGEAVEVSFPNGTSLTGWTIVLYNGSGGAVYDTDALAGLTQTACAGSARFVVTLTYPSNGIQNGSPDGIALVGPGNVVREFLSYEGTFTAVGGPANGMVSTDIGRSQNGSEAPGLSLQRSGSGDNVWSTPTANTFNACNDDFVPPPEVASVEVTPETATIIEGGTQQFSATAYDAANQPISGVVFTWTSNAASTATVSATGLATGVNSGSAQIRATAPNGATDFGALQVDEPPVEPPAGDVNIVEIHYDNTGTDAGEAFEVQGPAGLNLSGWSVVLYNQTGGVQYATIALSGVFADQCSGRGTLQFPAVGMQNGPADGLALVKPGVGVVEFLSYEGTLTATNGPAVGLTSTNIGVDEDGDEPLGRSLQKDADGWYGPVASSFGACNQRPVVPPSFIMITGRTAGDAPLPVGYQDQLFGSLINGSGDTEPTTITWSSDTPGIAVIDATTGVMTAIAAGTATMRATATNGTTSTIALPTRIATAGGAVYAGHTEFGVPTDADPGDDYILERTEYTFSFNKLRGIPNWVSFNLEATHFGPEDRCDCFTFDPLLPPEFTRYTTADYTGAGTFHGYGIDRGHLARSFDRTSGSLDNARSFLFSNIIPQAADNNQGPWANMENYVGDLARTQNKEVYVIAGASGSKGTVKNEGKMTIPTTTWKVVVIMPRDQGLANVDSYDDVEVIAVIMPNDPGIRNVDWNTYRTTVDQVEAVSGYDFLKLLPDQVEIAVESGTRPPTAALNGPYASNEGASVSMSGAASSDPDAGDVLTYDWSFGDGTTASGVAVSHAYGQNGSYAVTLTVTDSRGLVSVATTTATVANVAPVIASFNAPATAVSGVPVSATGSFSDPGVNDAPWSYSVSWGEGAPTAGSVMSQAIVVGGSHTYLSAGTYTLRLTVTDKDGGWDQREVQVQVVRLAVPGEVDHEKINLRPRDNGNHRISFYVLSTSSFDATSIVAATARIGGVGVAVKQNHTDLETDARDVNGDGRTDLVLDFYRADLVSAGALTPSTTQLVLTANLVDGRQIESRVVVSPK